ncbi:hypothetical protein GCM10027347_55710 [Larkinella harenae]
MELPQVTNWLTYKTIRRTVSTHYIRQAEVPTDYFVSLPLPTLRAGIPAFACFASAFIREIPEADSNTPIRITYSPPDRWWLLSARGQYLLQYTMCSLLNFTDRSFEHFSVTDTRSLVEVQKLLKTIEQYLETIVPAFFEKSPVSEETKKNLHEALTEFIPPQQLHIYDALVPDFFQWLTSY